MGSNLVEHSIVTTNCSCPSLSTMLSISSAAKALTAAIAYRSLFEHERLKRGSSASPPPYRAEAFNELAYAPVRQKSPIDTHSFQALRSMLDAGQCTRCAPCGADHVMLVLLNDAHVAPERERRPEDEAVATAEPEDKTTTAEGLANPAIAEGAADNEQT